MEPLGRQLISLHGHAAAAIMEVGSSSNGTVLLQPPQTMAAKGKKLELVVGFHEGRRQLPIVVLRRAV